MIKLANLVLCSIVIWTAFLLFWTSQSVQKVESELKRLKEVSYNESEMVRVLSSEWDYLNRPERIEKLAQKYLSIKRAQPNQNSFITSAELVEKTQALVIPSVKTKAMLQKRKVLKTVSAQKRSVKKDDFVPSKLQSAIGKPEREKFINMIDGLTEGGD